MPSPHAGPLRVSVRLFALHLMRWHRVARIRNRFEYQCTVERRHPLVKLSPVELLQIYARGQELTKTKFLGTARGQISQAPVQSEV
jgi:hypothetical protein